MASGATSLCLQFGGEKNGSPPAVVSSVSREKESRHDLHHVGSFLREVFNNGEAAVHVLDHVLNFQSRPVFVLDKASKCTAGR
jgi:hypothetical protein